MAPARSQPVIPVSPPSTQEEAVEGFFSQLFESATDPHFVWTVAAVCTALVLYNYGAFILKFIVVRFLALVRWVVALSEVASRKARHLSKEVDEQEEYDEAKEDLVKRGSSWTHTGEPDSPPVRKSARQLALEAKKKKEEEKEKLMERAVTRAIDAMKNGQQAPQIQAPAVAVH